MSNLSTRPSKEHFLCSRCNEWVYGGGMCGDCTVVWEARKAERRRQNEKGRTGACCDAATKIACVCRYAWECDTHGETHIGTHE